MPHPRRTGPRTGFPEWMSSITKTAAPATPSVQATQESLIGPRREEQLDYYSGIYRQFGDYVSELLTSGREVSGRLKQQRAREFQTLKERLAQQGHYIIGDDPTTAVGISSAAIQNLSDFQQRYTLAAEQEYQFALTGGIRGVVGTASSEAGLTGAALAPLPSQQQEYSLARIKAGARDTGGGGGWGNFFQSLTRLGTAYLTGGGSEIANAATGGGLWNPSGSGNAYI